MKSNSHLKLRALCEGAVFVAMAQVLGYIKLFELPQGGAINFGMLPIFIFCARWGFGKGMLASFCYSLLQLLLDGAYAWGWQSMILDYLLAFTPLGLAGLFRGRAWGIFPGTILGCAGRFAVHYLSGVTIYRINMPTEIPGFGVFDSAELYSLVYNGCYMLPCAVIALVIACALYVPMKPYFEGRDLR